MRAFDVLVVGAGPAGIQVATGLSDAGYSGTVALLERDLTPPYERPPLSKGFLRGEIELEAIHVRSEEYWQRSGVELLLGQPVERLDPTERTVRTEAGEVVGYGQLVWATGGVARRLHLPGNGLRGVLSLRTADDAAALRAAAHASLSAVIVGGGHIGLEVAAGLRARGLEVTVVESQDRLLSRVTAPVVSRFYASLHESNGVSIRTGVGVSSIVGAEGRVTGVALTDGSTLGCDLVVVGIGLIPEVEVLASAGALCSNGVNVDAQGRTSLLDVFAVGDCAIRPHPFAELGHVRMESIPNAVEQARNVVNVLVGRIGKETAPPWFWSHQYDTRLQTIGLLTGYDSWALRGEVSSGRFSVIYLRKGRVIAADCVNSTRDFSRCRDLVARGTLAAPEELTTVDDLTELLIAAPRGR